MLSPNRKTVESPYEWMTGFNILMQEADIPVLDGSTLFIGSNYSGQHHGSDYSVISILVADIDKSTVWPQLRREIRQEFLSDGRRMSFKGLNDRAKQRALEPFLFAAGQLHGVCASFVVSKKIGGLVTHKNLLRDMETQFGFHSDKWNPYEFEKIARITHFVAVLIAGLARPNQNINWISDDDNIFANQKRKKDTALLLSKFVSLYVKDELGDLEVGTTELDPGDRGEEDFTAIPYLIAGALSDILPTLAKDGNLFDSDEIQINPPEIKEKTNYISNWLFDTPKKLKQISMVFDKDQFGRVLLYPFELH